MSIVQQMGSSITRAVCQPEGAGVPFETTAKRFDNPAANYYRGGVGNMFPSSGGETGVTRVVHFYPRSKLGAQTIMSSTGINNWVFGWHNVGGGVGPIANLRQNIFTQGPTHVFSAHPVAGVGVTLNVWHSYAVSWNLTTGVVDYVFDGVYDASFYTENLASGTTLFDYSSTEEFMGSGTNHNTGDFSNVDISQYWMDDQYIDLSVPANIAKFIDGTGKPVDLGATGASPTGTQPLHFNPSGDMTNNLGTQANWIEVGTVLAAPTSPTD